MHHKASINISFDRLGYIKSYEIFGVRESTINPNASKITNRALFRVQDQN